MHEAGIARRAIEAALDQLPAADRSRRPIRLDVRINPARISGDSLTLHLELVLQELDLAGLPIVVTPESAACPTCGTPSSGEVWLLCESCGAPLPAVDGPMAVARFRFRARRGEATWTRGPMTHGPARSGPVRGG